MLWQQDMSSYAGSARTSTKVYVTSDVDSVIALDRSARARRSGARTRCGCATSPRPTRFGNAIVVGDFEGYLHWLDPDDGHFVAREHAAGDRIVRGAARRRR